MKNILIPIDFSENSDDALLYAIQFAHGTNANLHLLYVVDDNISTSFSGIDYSNLLKIEIDTAEEKMALLFDNLHKVNQHNKVSTKVTSGSITALIEEEATNIHADLIILGTRGSNYNIIDRTFGTTCLSVIKNSSHHLLIIPKGHTYKTIENVVFATNLNPDDPFTLWRAIKVLQPHTVVIQCLYVMKDEQSKDTALFHSLSSFMIEYSPALKTIFQTEVSENPANTIVEHADNYDAEMIIMHTSKRSIWSQMISTSSSLKVLYNIDRPLLLITE